MTNEISSVKNVELAKTVAAALLKIKAVFLSPQAPFTWASGIQSPIYCDNRLTLAHPEIRKLVEEGFARTVKAQFPACEVLMGTATAGIAHAAITADYMGLPMGYVRGSAKAHGRNNQIEGAAVAGKKVVVIEDLISTAGSSIEVVDALREAGAEVLGMVSIFTYTLQKGIDRLAASNVTNVSLSDIHILLEVAVEENYISAKEKEMVKKFIANPSDPSWAD